MIEYRRQLVKLLFIFVSVGVLILPAVNAGLTLEGQITPSPNKSGYEVSITLEMYGKEPVSQTADPDGYYRFDGLPSGWKMVTITSSKKSCTRTSSYLISMSYGSNKYNYDLGTFPCNPEVAGELKGVVIDKTGDPIPAVEVQLHHVEMGSLSCVTSEIGSFVFSRLPVGSYDLTAESMGLKPLRNMSIKVTPAGNEKLTLTMFVQEISPDDKGLVNPVGDDKSSSTGVDLEKEFLERLP